jgi:large subunit ribosomal protein L17
MSVADLTAKSRDKLTAEEKASIVHAMRQARRQLRNEEAVDKLFHDLAARFRGRQGGYTRILKTRVRLGDAAPMAFVELTERAGAEPAPEPETPAKGKAAKAKAPPAKAAAPAAKAKGKTEKAEKAEKKGPKDDKGEKAEKAKSKKK